MVKRYEPELAETTAMYYAAMEQRDRGDYVLFTDYETVERERDALREAALAVVERWDSPAWTWDGSTAELIGKLRTALAKEST